MPFGPFVRLSMTAELSGVDTLRAKIEAYMISAFFLGIIGGIETYWLTYINPIWSSMSSSPSKWW